MFHMPCWVSVTRCWQGTASPSISPTGWASLAEWSPPVRMIFLLGEVLAGAAAETRLAGGELLGLCRGLVLGAKRFGPVRVLPQVAVTRVEEYAVALTDRDPSPCASTYYS